MSHPSPMHILHRNAGESVLPSAGNIDLSNNIILPLRMNKGPYPDFRIEPTTVNPPFVSAVAAILKTLRYRDVEGMDTTTRKVFTTMKSKGFTAGFKYFIDNVLFLRQPYNPVMVHQATDIFDLQLGEYFGRYVMDRMTAEQIATFFPFYDFEFHAHDDTRSIEVTFTALEMLPMQGGNAYYAPSRPTIHIDDMAKVVAFRKHAIDRIRERIYAGELDYRRTGSFHQRLQEHHLFEPRVLYKGQQAFAFWTRARTGILYRNSNGLRFIRELVPKCDSRKDYWYLLGYCPVTIHHGFAVAQTLLYPGFKNTPEYGLIMNSALSLSEKHHMLARVQAWEEGRNEAQTDMNLVRWFHEHGSPQVMATDGKTQ